MSLLELLELLLLVLELAVRMLTQVRLQEAQNVVSTRQAAERVTLLETGDTRRQLLR
jgi:hypothetical protein